MFAALTCDTGFFHDLCARINDHDPSGYVGPVATWLLGPVCFLIATLLVGRLLRRVSARAPVINRDAQVHTLVYNVLSASMYLIAILGALVVAGLPLSVLLTVGGLSSLAVGLAFQDVLRNILAGIFLLVEQTFKIGDVITVGDNSGVVESIQLRTTTLKMADGRVAIVPNLACFSSPVVNLTAFASRRYTVSLRVPRDRPLDEVIRKARAVVTEHKSIATTPSPTVRPQVDGEESLVHCDYWLDYRSFDPDTVAADVATSLSGLGLKTGS